MQTWFRLVRVQYSINDLSLKFFIDAVACPDKVLNCCLGTSRYVIGIILLEGYYHFLRQTGQKPQAVFRG